MKLYATTTSERATKGQGGNEYVETIFLNEKREKIASMMVEIHDGHIAVIYFIDKEKIASIGVVEKPQEKAKKETGEYQCELCKEHYSLWHSCRRMVDIAKSYD